MSRNQASGKAGKSAPGSIKFRIFVNASQSHPGTENHDKFAANGINARHTDGIGEGASLPEGIYTERQRRLGHHNPRPGIQEGTEKG